MNPIFIHIPKELFEPAETQTFSGSFNLGPVCMGADEYTFVAPCTWSVTITNTGGALLLQGNARTEGVCACSRCLEDASVSFNAAIEGYFLISPEEVDEDLEDDEFQVLPEDHKIDIAPLIEQGLLLNAPLQPLCQDDCAGLCPHCGANKNVEPCSCSAEQGPVDAAHPFAVLKNLDLTN